MLIEKFSWYLKKGTHTKNPYVISSYKSTFEMFLLLFKLIKPYLSIPVQNDYLVHVLKQIQKPF